MEWEELTLSTTQARSQQTGIIPSPSIPLLQNKHKVQSKSGKKKEKAQKNGKKEWNVFPHTMVW